MIAKVMKRRSERTIWWWLEHLLNIFTGFEQTTEKKMDFWWGDDEPFDFEKKCKNRYLKLLWLNFAALFFESTISGIFIAMQISNYIHSDGRIYFKLGGTELMLFITFLFGAILHAIAKTRFLMRNNKDVSTE